MMIDMRGCLVILFLGAVVVLAIYGLASAIGAALS